MIALSILTPYATLNPLDYSILTTIGTSMVLYSIRSKNLVNQLLAWSPLLYLGIISYSVYLYHYPIISIATALDLNDGHIYVNLKLILIGITLALSIVSYEFIEKKFTRYENRKD